MLDKILKQLRFAFVLSLIFSSAFLIADVLYTLKMVPQENAALERWGIIITLFGIFGTLKLLHPKLTAIEKTDNATALRKYAFKYYIRLFALIAIYVFNLVSLHFTGVKNFLFLGIITIFALLFCAPSRENIENETRVHED